MIDLHCHILPGIDDGAGDLDTALEMARMAVDDGTTHLACTPHITPGIYHNDANVILPAVERLREAFAANSVSLTLTTGADIHVTPDLVEGLRTGRYPTLAGSRYFLLEPPHHVLPPGLERYCNEILESGYVPVLTHPERLTWIEDHYAVICKLDEAGVLVQLTAGSITGRFGERAQYWSQRMLLEGRVDLIASDGHNVRGRPPKMSNARALIAELLDDASAERMTVTIPGMIWRNEAVPAKPPRRNANIKEPKNSRGVLGWLGVGR